VRRLWPAWRYARPTRQCALHAEQPNARARSPDLRQGRNQASLFVNDDTDGNALRPPFRSPPMPTPANLGFHLQAKRSVRANLAIIVSNTNAMKPKLPARLQRPILF